MNKRFMGFVVLIVLAAAVAFVNLRGSDNEPVVTENGSGSETVTASSSGSNEPAASSEPQELVVIQFSDIVSLDPHKTNDSYSSTVLMQIYDRLVNLDPDMNIIPGLAKEWKAVDDLTWQFTLEQGVKFHNGEELKASDVKFTFDRHTDPAMAAPASFMLTTVKETKIIDDYTVQIITSEPNASLIYNLAHSDMAILSEKAVTEAGDDYALKPVGTGPFKLVERIISQHVVMEKNEDYFKGPAKLDKLTVRIIPEGATAMAELKAGSAEMILQMDTQYANQFGEGTGLALDRFSTFTANYISFDTRKKPFDDVRVRQAVNYAIDKESVIKMVYSGFAQQLTGPLPPKVHGTNDALTGYPFDLEKARALMAEAGYAEGFSTTLYLNDNNTVTKLATVLQAQLKEIGINIELQVLEWGAFLEATSGGLPMFVLGWITVTADADNGMYALFHTNSWGTRGNRSFYSNPEVDKLLDQGRAEFDDAVRVGMYHKAQEIIAEEAPWGFITANEYLVGRSDKVKGFVPMPTTLFQFYSVYME